MLRCSDVLILAAAIEIQFDSTRFILAFVSEYVAHPNESNFNQTTRRFSDLNQTLPISIDLILGCSIGEQEMRETIEVE